MNSMLKLTVHPSFDNQEHGTTTNTTRHGRPTMSAGNKNIKKRSRLEACSYSG